MTDVMLVVFAPPLRIHTATNSSGSRNGSSRSNAAFTTVNTAVFAPIPSPSVIRPRS
jgi:hypothetical protein